MTCFLKESISFYELLFQRSTCPNSVKTLVKSYARQFSAHCCLRLALPLHCLQKKVWGKNIRLKNHYQPKVHQTNPCVVQVCNVPKLFFGNIIFFSFWVYKIILIVPKKIMLTPLHMAGGFEPGYGGGWMKKLTPFRNKLLFFWTAVKCWRTSMK